MAKVLTRQERVESYIYAIKAVGTNRYKIGTTTDLKGRLATVQTGCPYPAQIVATWDGDRRLETAIHRELAEYRRVGEWFEIEEEWVIGWKVWRVLARLSEYQIQSEPAPVKVSRKGKKKSSWKSNRKAVLRKMKAGRASTLAYDKKKWKLSRVKPGHLIRRQKGHTLVESERGGAIS
jgi:hypothetical protein